MNRITLIVVAALLALGGSMFARPTSRANASADRPACVSICTVALKAGPNPKTWRSPQRFGDVALELGVFYGFAETSLHRRLKDAGCTGIYTGYGLKVTVKVCGKGAVPIRVTSMAEQPGTIFTFAYQAN